MITVGHGAGPSVPAVKVYEGWRWDSFADGAAAMRTLAQAGRAARPCCGCPTRTRPRSTSPSPTRSAATRGGGCLMIAGFEGTQEAVDASRAAAVTALLTGSAAPRSARRRTGWSSRPLPRSLPARLDARRRRAGRDAGDGDLLVQPAPGCYDAVKAALTGALGEGTRWCSATSRTSTRPAPRSTSPSPPSRPTTRSRSGWRPRPPRPTRYRQPAPRSPTTTRSASDHKPWLAREIGPVGVQMLRALKAELDPTGVLNPGVLIP